MASSSCADSPPAYASYDVLVHQLAVLRPASSRPNLAVKPLPFASSYRLITTWFSAVIFLQRTFTSLVHAHAGRTQSQSGDLFELAPKVANTNRRLLLALNSLVRAFQSSQVNFTTFTLPNSDNSNSNHVVIHFIN